MRSPRPLCVRAASQEEDREPFEEMMKRPTAKWRERQPEASRLDDAVTADVEEPGFG